MNLTQFPADAWLIVIAAGAIAALFVFMVRVRARPPEVRTQLRTASSGKHETLVVMVHGLLGREDLAGAEKLVAKVLPDADQLVVDYGGDPVSNLDPYVAADALERGVHAEWERYRYRSVILLGHSAGATLLRKAFVWAHGHEEDRQELGRCGRREWVNHVERMVLLAGMNRGWSTSPRPRAMPRLVWARLRSVELLARVLRVGKFSLAMRRGSPFIADARVQWLAVARSEAVLAGRQVFPLVVQLIGSRDDLVSREDGQDLLPAPGTVFKTLPQTGHRDIADVVSGKARSDSTGRAEMIGHALIGDIDALEPDLVDLPPLRPEINTIIYIMHGIRDYAEWTDELRHRISSRTAKVDSSTLAISPKYGYFGMLRFLVHGDRQRNVRRFMDQYTEDLARCPNVKAVDFCGHSNGTYILASALQGYATVKVRRVFFAGSVVPKHYPWNDLMGSGRVAEVVNEVATADWVVAIFPKLHEQIADQLKITPSRGWLDLGAGGYHGFLDADGVANVTNLKYWRGDHSIAVNFTKDDKLDAIATYLIDGRVDELQSHTNVRTQPLLLGLASRLAFVVWFILLAVVAVIGLVLFCAGGWTVFAIYLLIVVAVLNWV